MYPNASPWWYFFLAVSCLWFIRPWLRTCFEVFDGNCHLGGASDVFEMSLCAMASARRPTRLLGTLHRHNACPSVFALQSNVGIKRFRHSYKELMKRSEARPEEKPVGLRSLESTAIGFALELLEWSAEKQIRPIRTQDDLKKVVSDLSEFYENLKLNDLQSVRLMRHWKILEDLTRVNTDWRGIWFQVLMIKSMQVDLPKVAISAKERAAGESLAEACLFAQSRRGAMELNDEERTMWMFTDNWKYTRRAASLLWHLDLSNIIIWPSIILLRCSSVLDVRNRFRKYGVWTLSMLSFTLLFVYLCRPVSVEPSSPSTSEEDSRTGQQYRTARGWRRRGEIPEWSYKKGNESTNQE